MTLKLNGSTSGSVALDAPADTSPSGTDVTLTLPTSAGSSGQYLQTNGSGTLTWASPTAPEILQVVHSRNATQGSVTNTTAWQDSGLTATITPVAASSSILIFVSQYVYSLNSTVNFTQNGMKIRRGTTDLDEWIKGIYKTDSSTGAHAHWSNYSVYYLDTPTYTLGNDVSYNTQVKASNSTNSTLTWNSSPSTMTLVEIAA